MKIKIENLKKHTPTLFDVPYGDIFLLMEDGEAYVKCRMNSELKGVYKCLSLRDGFAIDISNKAKVRLVRDITIEAEDFPKRG